MSGMVASGVRLPLVAAGDTSLSSIGSSSPWKGPWPQAFALPEVFQEEILLVAPGIRRRASPFPRRIWDASRARRRLESYAGL
jgi:hypothetical protein